MDVDYQEYMNANGDYYKRSPGGEWVIDEEAHAREQEGERKRLDLIWALRTRILSADEMDVVRGYDYRLLIGPNEIFMESDRIRQFNDLMMMQFNMRLASEKAKQ